MDKDVQKRVKYYLDICHKAVRRIRRDHRAYLERLLEGVWMLHYIVENEAEEKAEICTRIGSEYRLMSISMKEGATAQLPLVRNAVVLLDIERGWLYLMAGEMRGIDNLKSAYRESVRLRKTARMLLPKQYWTELCLYLGYAYRSCGEVQNAIRMNKKAYRSGMTQMIGVCLHGRGKRIRNELMYLCGEMKAIYGKKDRLHFGKWNRRGIWVQVLYGVVSLLWLFDDRIAQAFYLMLLGGWVYLVYRYLLR